MRATTLQRFALGLLLLAACGDDDAPPVPPPLDGGVDSGPLPMGIAASLELSVNPGRAAYYVDQSVRVEYVLRDADGMPVAGEVSFGPEPASGAMDAGDSVYTLTAEGFLEFRGCAVMNPEVCDFVRILVDDGAPNLEVSSPLPGAELGGDGATAIEVAGSVADGRDVVVYVNGTAATLDDMGNFTASVAPLFGVNHLDIVASDGVSEQTQVRMDVLWADAYIAPDPGESPSITFDEGLVLQLGQGFFDDGSPLDTGAEPLMTQDLADVFELVLSRADVRSLLPDPIIDTSALTVRMTDVRLSDIDVELDVVEGGAELFVRIGTFDADTTGSLAFEGTMLDLGGGITASMSAFARLTLTKDGPDAPVEAGVEGLEIAVESVDGRFVSEEANAILRLAEGALRSTLESTLADALGDTLLDALPAVLGDAIGALDTALRDQTIPITADIFPPVTLHIDGRLSELRSEYRRFLRAPLRFSVSTEATIAHPETRGTADLLGSDDALFGTVPVQLGARLAVLNGLLHTLWNSGLLEIDATALLPEGIADLVTEATLSGRMAPVLRPARGAETDDLVLALGQAELELVVLEDRVRFGVTIEAGATLDIVDGGLVLDIAEDPFIRTWIIESNTTRPLVDAEGLEGIIRSQLWPQLRDTVASGLVVNLPSLDVGDLSSLAPDLAGFSLGISLAERLDIRERDLVLDLAITGSL